MFKRLSAAILVCAMLFAVSIPVFASDIPGENATESTTVAMEELTEGTMATPGQEPPPPPAPKPVAVEWVSLQTAYVTLQAGDTFRLKATVGPSDADNKSVTWRSNNSKIATVNQNGLVSVRKNAKKGKVTITVTTKDGKKTDKCVVSVGGVPVKRVKLEQRKVTLNKGKTFMIKATVLPEDASNKDVTFTSSNKKIATVTKNGKVKAIRSGKATITVKTNDGGKVIRFSVRVR